MAPMRNSVERVGGLGEQVVEEGDELLGEEVKVGTVMMVTGCSAAAKGRLLPRSTHCPGSPVD